MLALIRGPRASRRLALSLTASLLILASALPSCGGAPVAPPRPPPPPGWSDFPRPVFGVGVQLPDDWALNEGDAVSFATPKPPGDDAVVLFVKVPDGDARALDQVVAKYLPLRDARYASPATEGTAVVVDGALPVHFWSHRMSTASGTVVVALVLKTAATDRSGAIVQRIGASLRVADPPKVIDKKPPHDLAGRPLDTDKPAADPQGRNDVALESTRGS